MSLVDLINNSKTDKNTTHSYMELYETLLRKKKDSAQRVLEVGIGDFGEKNGGSIKLWRDYFTNATIYGLDILPINRVMDELTQDNRIVLFVQTNAYDETFFKTTFIEPGLKFDVQLDDGPHSLESMIQFIKLYSQVMTEDGILMIEDVQDMTWLDVLREQTPDTLKPFIKVYDLRGNKGRYDDIVFTIDKS